MFRLLEHKWTTNIVGILGVLVAAIVPIGIFILEKLEKSGATGPKPDTSPQWTRTEIFLIIIICVLFLIHAVYFINARARRTKSREQEVIRKLCALQESYILTPHYVTATEHASHSKEGALSNGGTADILTNSLKYDMFYSGGIAENIIKGAKYVYVLPYTRSVIEDLQNYITTIRESIRAELQTKGATAALTKVDELCSTNLEFWFFNNENPCLYNFAIFRQTAGQGMDPFKQYWWYINPSDKSADSHMLSHEIEPVRDKSDLDEVFGILKKSASKRSGQEVYVHRTSPGDWIGGKEQ